MSTTLANARIQLSKDLGDYWAGTTTSSGSSTTVVDTALKAKSNDWISDAPQEMYDLITSGTYDGEERKISSLDNTSGTLTTLAHGGTIGSSVTYEVHRMFSASDKRIALIQAAKTAFPSIFAKINDITKTTGNWLLNGDVEYWTTSTYPDYWRASGATATKSTTAKLFKRGAASCALSAGTGYLYQDWTYNDDLKNLRGETVTFTAEAWSAVASQLRLAIYDGTTTTYSDYHAGNSTWSDDVLTVTATIDEEATDVSFRVYYESASATAYVDDLRVIGVEKDRIYIGDLGLFQNQPHSVEVTDSAYINEEPWVKIHHYYVDSDGYLVTPGLDYGYILRIKGIGYLDFLASGVSSTAWTATIAIDSPQLYILTAEAVLHLLTQLALPNFTSGQGKEYGPVMEYWAKHLEYLKSKFKMMPPAGTVTWGGI